MMGRILIFRSGGSLADPPEVRLVNDPAEWSDINANLDALRAILDDDIEQVPYFDSIQLHERVRPCVALCGENGKLKNLKVNRQATMLWRAALKEHADIPAPLLAGAMADVLVGTVVVLTGDPEFMAAL